MNAHVKHLVCAVKPTAQIGHNGGPDMEAERLFEIIGPRPKTAPAVFQCGAPWTAYATDSELKRLGVVQARIERRKRALEALRKERTKVMMRCVRRMRRERVAE